ncbi:MAG: cryptochrome/photolyase family protein [Cyanobacteria bacterium TGS_CYA1]|nr:cryptochrome/photolyase family protein [Cyanobacteria bacterium TGS_CYA1]
MKNTALKSADKSNSVVLMIESVKRGNQIQYHKKKLVLIYSVMRHFALELEEAGWKVDYYKEYPDFADAVKKHFDKHKTQKLLIMEQSEYGANERLQKLIPKDIEVEITAHCNFISTKEEFEKLHKSKDSRVTMENFYHVMRKKTNLLMDGADPVGGSWNYDKSNRLPPDKDFKWKEIKRFEPDQITKDVIKMVDKHFANHPGSTDNFMYAVTREDAVLAAKDFIKYRLNEFGPHQDAMLEGKPFLNHSILSPYINTCLLHPLELARKAEEEYREGRAQLSSVEGFIRQLIGWREFVWRVYWRLMPEYKERNELFAEHKVPEFFWTGKTKMHCMQDSLKTTIDNGYAHHIVRLMLLGNFSLIAGLSPLAVNEWFTQMFVDGYDWVMVPNVIGMTLHADGGYVGTKPYAASANYINKMSDYCKKCHYDQKLATGEKACPFNTLYWDFLIRNEGKFKSNHRMAMMMKNLAGKPDHWRAEIDKQARTIMRNINKI